MEICSDHRPVQHRDGKEPWCKNCGLTGDLRVPVSYLETDHREKNLQEKAKDAVVNYFNSKTDKTDEYYLSINKVYVVWFSKVLQNWKALVSTTLPDGMYYEVTYNGDKKETYIDAYKKFDNVAVPDKEE